MPTKFSGKKTRTAREIRHYYVFASIDAKLVGIEFSLQITQLNKSVVCINGRANQMIKYFIVIHHGKFYSLVFTAIPFGLCFARIATACKLVTSP